MQFYSNCWVSARASEVLLPKTPKLLKHGNFLYMSLVNLLSFQIIFLINMKDHVLKSFIWTIESKRELDINFFHQLSNKNSTSESHMLSIFNYKLSEVKLGVFILGFAVNKYSSNFSFWHLNCTIFQFAHNKKKGKGKKRSLFVAISVD